MAALCLSFLLLYTGILHNSLVSWLLHIYLQMATSPSNVSVPLPTCTVKTNLNNQCPYLERQTTIWPCFAIPCSFFPIPFPFLTVFVTFRINGADSSIFLDGNSSLLKISTPSPSLRCSPFSWCSTGCSTLVYFVLCNLIVSIISFTICCLYPTSCLTMFERRAVKSVNMAFLALIWRFCAMLFY